MIPVRSMHDLLIYRPGERSRDLAQRLDCSELTAAVLDSRAGGEERCRELLNAPGLRAQLAALDLGRPAEAARQLWPRAIRGKKVFVYGDYDTDGVASMVLALELAQAGGAALTVYYIPDRRTEGYGLHPEHVRRAAADGFETLIVTDCGSKDVEAVAAAKDAGMDVIIFDHHAAAGTVVSLETLVNPQIDGDAEAKRLCATSLLWCWAWQSRLLPERTLAALIQLAALATVSDCMPLDSLNRSITHEGIAAIRRAPRRGLRELILALGPADASPMVDENFLSMRLIPCLNAAGRVHVADVAVDVLLGQGSGPDLDRSVADLIELNRRRRDLSTTICAAVDERLGSGEPSQVFFNGSWPVGILSAVASRLSSEHNKAFALAAPSGSSIRGTLRVPAGANAVEILEGLDNLLEAWGGHRSAAGFTVNPLKWQRLSRELNAQLQGIVSERPRTEVIEFDPDRITSGAWNDVLRIGPFGNGNPAPAFFAPFQPGTTYEPLGKRGLHSKVLTSGGTLIAFGGAGQISRTEGIRGWIYRPRPNLWRGRVSLQYIIEGIVVA